MSCCDETTARVPSTDVSRRSVFKGAALIASVIPAVRPGDAAAQGKRIKLAYCSQLLCGVPYEVARSGGLFKKHGLDVELVYTRGGSAAMQALVGGAVDYAATSLDVAHHRLRQCRRRHPPLRRHRPAAAVRARHRAEDRRPDPAIKALEGKTVAVSGARQCRSRADALSAQAGRRRRRQGPVRDPGRQSPRGAAAGPDRRRPGAGAGLTLLHQLGRARAGERAWTSPTRRNISAAPTSSWASRCAPRRSSSASPRCCCSTKALADALKALHTMSGDQLVAALPKEMTTGLDLKQFGDILARYRDSLYPGSRDHRSRRRQARRPEPHRRRPAQARRQHFRAARHDDRRGLNAARLRPDDFLRRRAGARRGEPRRRRRPVREPGRPVGLRQVEPAARGDRPAEAARRHASIPRSRRPRSAFCSRTTRCCRGRRRATTSRSGSTFNGVERAAALAQADTGSNGSDSPASSIAIRATSAAASASASRSRRCWR